MADWWSPHKKKLSYLFENFLDAADESDGADLMAEFVQRELAVAIDVETFPVAEHSEAQATQ